MTALMGQLSMGSDDSFSSHRTERGLKNVLMGAEKVSFYLIGIMPGKLTDLQHCIPPSMIQKVAIPQFASFCWHKDVSAEVRSKDIALLCLDEIR